MGPGHLRGGYEVCRVSASVCRADRRYRRSWGLVGTLDFRGKDAVVVEGDATPLVAESRSSRRTAGRQDGAEVARAEEEELPTGRAQTSVEGRNIAGNVEIRRIEGVLGFIVGRCLGIGRPDRIAVGGGGTHVGLDEVTDRVAAKVSGIELACPRDTLTGPTEPAKTGSGALLGEDGAAVRRAYRDGDGPVGVVGGQKLERALRERLAGGVLDIVVDEDGPAGGSSRSQ